MKFIGRFIPVQPTTWRRINFIFAMYTVNALYIEYLYIGSHYTLDTFFKVGLIRSHRKLEKQRSVFWKFVHWTLFLPTFSVQCIERSLYFRFQLS